MLNTVPSRNVLSSLRPTLFCSGILGVSLFALSSTLLFADDISSTDKYAWSENAAWLNFKSTHRQVTVYDDHLEGYVWAAKVGWIKLGSYAGGGTHTYANSSSTDWGVNNDGGGNLSGYAWGENIGWINFNPSDSQVTIDAASGDFSGYAWAAKIGWIHFQNSSPAYKVQRLLPDSIPDSFIFTDVSGVTLNAITASSPITVSGITVAATISVTGGEYEISGSGVWLTAASTVNNGDTVIVRHTSSNNYSNPTHTILTIGTVSDTFTSTTVGDPAPAPVTAPIATPVPTPTPIFQPTPSPTPDATPTETPMPTPSTSPAPTVTVTSTPEPTPTPSSTPTSEPTPLPSPTPIISTNLFDVEGSAFSATPIDTLFTTDTDIGVENIIAVITLEASNAKIEREHGSVVEINSETVALFHPEYRRPVGAVDTLQNVVSLIRGEINTLVSCDIKGQFRVQTGLGVIIVVRDNLCDVESSRRNDEVKNTAEFKAQYTTDELQASLTVSSVSGSITVIDNQGNATELAPGQEITLRDQVRKSSWVLPVDGGYIYGGMENLLSWTAYPGAAGYLLEYNAPIPIFSDDNTETFEFPRQTIRLFPNDYEVYEDLILYRITLGDVHDGSLIEARIFPIDAQGNILTGSVSSDKTSVRWR